MKWFNAEKYLVVILEDGDVFGPEGELVHRGSERRLRIFETCGKPASDDYPLLADLRLSEMARLAAEQQSLELANGEAIDANLVSYFCEFAHSILRNSGAVTGVHPLSALQAA